MLNYKTNEHIKNFIDDIVRIPLNYCKEMHLLAKKVVQDLEKPNVIILHDKIQEAINYMEKYFFTLLPWERFVTAMIVGVYQHGKLLYNELFIMVARGNGKNGFLGALCNYFQTHLHGIQEYNIDIVANSEKQAKTSFMDVYNMLHKAKNDKVRKKFYRVTKKEIEFKSTQSILAYNTSNADTKDGLRSGCVVFDEVHSYTSTDTIDVFTSGLGKKADPRIIYITTDGKVRDGVIDTFKEEADMILKGELPNSRILPIIFKMDSEDEVSLEREELWVKANPSLPYMPILKDQIRTDLEKSQTRPQAKIETYTKRFNLPKTDLRTAVADWKKIKATKTEFVDDTFFGESCIGGLDYASIRDFMSAVLLFKRGEKYYLKHHTWIHRESLLYTQYKVDIDRAVEMGLCTIVDNESKILEPSLACEWFEEQAKNYQIITVALDNYRAKYVMEEFDKYGIPYEMIRNGSYSHTQMHPIIEKMFAKEQIKWGDDLLMRWYTNNTYVKVDKKDNKTYEKIEPIKRKTDGFMAFIHAFNLRELLASNSDDYWDEIKCYS